MAYEALDSRLKEKPFAFDRKMDDANMVRVILSVSKGRIRVLKAMVISLVGHFTGSASPDYALTRAEKRVRLASSIGSWKTGFKKQSLLRRYPQERSRSQQVGAVQTKLRSLLPQELTGHVMFWAAIQTMTGVFEKADLSARLEVWSLGANASHQTDFNLLFLKL